MLKRWSACCCLIAVLSQISFAQKPAFEVASIRPNADGGASYLLWPKGRFSATNVTARTLLEFAYRVGPMGSAPQEQIVGGPAWLDTDLFDIQANTGGAARKEDMQIMLQSLLEDRFHLKVHSQMKELPVYNLVVMKGGPKLKPSADQSPENPGHLETQGTSSGSIIIGNAVPMSALIDVLQRPAGRRVFDKTDLTGRFDVNLQFTSGPLTELESAPSIFTAIQTLGLKLESTKAPLEILVIDFIEKPTEN